MEVAETLGQSGKVTLCFRHRRGARCFVGIENWQGGAVVSVRYALRHPDGVPVGLARLWLRDWEGWAMRLDLAAEFPALPPLPVGWR